MPSILPDKIGKGMSHARRPIWLMHKTRLCSLVKTISDRHGGDDIEWLRQYCREMVDEWHDRLDEAIKCFEDIDKNTAWMESRRLWHGKKDEAHGRAASEQP